MYLVSARLCGIMDVQLCMCTKINLQMCMDQPYYCFSLISELLVLMVFLSYQGLWYRLLLVRLSDGELVIKWTLRRPLVSFYTLKSSIVAKFLHYLRQVGTQKKNGYFDPVISPVVSTSTHHGIV